MNRRRVFATGVLTFTLAFGVWTLAISFTPISSGFAAGDEVSASAFNQLFADIDANFDAAAAEFDKKVSTGGDGMTGALSIEGDTGTPDFLGSGTANAALEVINTNGDGISAYVEANSSQPALYVKNTGTGPLFRATNNSLGGLEVANDGSITITPDGSSNTISLDSVSGDITIAGSVRNQSGNALTPIAYGSVSASGSILKGTGNFSVTQTGSGTYEVDIVGESYHIADFVSVASSTAGAATVNSLGGALLIRTYDLSGSSADSTFTFVTYKP